MTVWLAKHSHSEAVNGSVLCLLSLLRETGAESITLPISNPFPSRIESGVSQLRKEVLLSPKPAVIYRRRFFMWILVSVTHPVRSVIGG